MRHPPRDAPRAVLEPAPGWTFAVRLSTLAAIQIAVRHGQFFSAAAKPAH